MSHPNDGEMEGKNGRIICDKMLSIQKANSNLHILFDIQTLNMKLIKSIQQQRKIFIKYVFLSLIQNCNYNFVVIYICIQISTWVKKKKTNVILEGIIAL